MKKALDRPTGRKAQALARSNAFSFKAITKGGNDMGKFVDLTGKRIGRLLVIKEYGRNKQGKATWLCKCDCGNEKIIYSYRLTSGETQSCGCLIKEINKKHAKHNKCKTRLYKTWANMKSRCSNPKATFYRYYGGKGIRVCAEWMEFENFYDWSIKNGYDEKLTLDRIDGKGDYQPDNCRWVTMKIQNNNKSSNKIVTYNGKSQSVAQWSEELGISYYALIQRFYLGWSLEKIFTYRG